MAQEELWTGFSGKGLYAKLAEHARKDSDGNPIVDTYARKDELPGSFIVSASVSGRTLTLTPDTGNPIEFSDTGDVNTIESISIDGTSISPSNKDVAIPLASATESGGVTAYVAGAMSGEDKGKLDSARSFSRVKVVESESPEVSANLDAAVLNDTLELVAGDNVSLEATTLPNRVRISSDAALEKSVYGTYVADEQGHAVTDEQGNVIYSENSVELYDTFKGTKFGAARAVADRLGNEIDETYATKDAATTSSAGLMPAADKAKLDGITDYVVSASVSGGTLTLTPKNGEAVTFTGDTNVIEGVKVGTDALVPDVNKVVTVPLFDGTHNGAVNAPASANRNSASFLSGMGDWSMLEEVTDADIDDIFVDGVTIGGRKYPYVQIGNQLWITKNLEYIFEYDGGTLPIGLEGKVTSPAAWYFNNDKNTYGLDGTYKCGLLYTWYAAKYLEDNKDILLPDGWHVPTQAEFNNLITTLGTNPSTKLKALDNSVTSNWPSNWNGTDDHGFNALPTGIRNTSDFGYFGLRTQLWSSSEIYGNGIYMGIFNNYSTVDINNFDKYHAYSIRLVKNLT